MFFIHGRSSWIAKLGSRDQDQAIKGWVMASQGIFSPFFWNDWCGLVIFMPIFSVLFIRIRKSFVFREMEGEVNRSAGRFPRPRMGKRAASSPGDTCARRDVVLY